MNSNSQRQVFALTGALFASLLATSLCFTTALAQESNAEAEGEIEEVITIGTRSQTRSLEDSPVPIDVITAADLEHSPNIPGELGGLLQTLVPSFSMPRQSNSDQSDIVRPAQMRGLSPDQVLVLVNGKRRHINSVISTESKLGRGSAPVDFNTIPVSAIERIEVLRDGASAQYGSDAIAGVINVVLKDDSDGGDYSISWGQHMTDLDPINDDIEDGETLTVSANQGFSVARGFVNVSLEVRDRNATNRAGFDQLPTIGFAEFIVPVPPSGTPEASANDALAGERNYLAGDGESTDINLAVNAGFELTSGYEVYGFGTLSDREAEGYNFFRYPISANSVREIHPNGFVPLSDANVTDYSLALGVRGEMFDGWAGDLSIVHGANEFDQDLKNSVNSSLGTASPTEFDIAEYKYDQTVINFDLARATQWSAMPVHVATGVELRNENYRTEAGDPASFAAGDAVACPECVTFGNSDTARPGAQASFGLTPADVVDEDRFAWSAYLDFEFDVTDRWLLSLAGRFEDYDDFGSTFNYKAATRYELVDGFALRGSVSTGFRAPALAQAFFAGTTTSFGENRSLVNTLSLPVTNPLAQANGAKDLDAEESTSATVGFTWFHDSGFSLTFDYYEIDIDDRIALSENIPVEGVPGVGQVRFFTNVVDTETTGFDVVASYALDQWSFNAAYNRTDTDITNDPNRDVFGIEERNTLETAPPEDKIVLSAQWTGNALFGLVRGVRYGETERIFDFGGGFEPQQMYGTEWSVDAEVGYRFTDNWSVALGANNLLDEYPDESIFDISYFGNLPYDTIPPLGFNGRFVYLKTRFQY